jgi:hypothetical protein
MWPCYFHMIALAQKIWIGLCCTNYDGFSRFPRFFTVFFGGKTRGKTGKSSTVSKKTAKTAVFRKLRTALRSQLSSHFFNPYSTQYTVHRREDTLVHLSIASIRHQCVLSRQTKISDIAPILSILRL